MCTHTPVDKWSGLYGSLIVDHRGYEINKTLTEQTTTKMCDVQLKTLNHIDTMTQSFNTLFYCLGVVWRAARRIVKIYVFIVRKRMYKCLTCCEG